MGILADARMMGRYLAGLREFWQAPPNWHDAKGTIRQWLAERESAFESMVRRHIFGNPASPYLRLMEAARFTEEQVCKMIRTAGVEGSLRQLYEAGVYVTLDEFKGRRPIRRANLEMPVTSASFNVVDSGRYLTSHTGGSRSQGTETPIDVRDLMYEIPPRYLFMQAYGLLHQPFALWRPAPPGVAGLRATLRNIKIGHPALRWFSPTRVSFSSASGKSAFVTLGTVLGSAAMGRHIPWPEYVPMDRADVIARWLAEEKVRGRLLHLDTMTSGAVFVAQAAKRLGLDISGHVMRVGGEPLTEAKAALFAEMGLRYPSHYAIAETGAVGLSCPYGAVPDDVHILTYRLAIIQQEKALPGWSEPIGAIFLTLFSPRMTKVMLNVEMGDYATMEIRECNCPLGEAGLNVHLHTIRSYEKLTSVGMHFMGADLLDLLENALPQRFGGGIGDYQFVEAEEDGRTVLKLIVASGVGPIEEKEVLGFVLSELERRTKAGRMMTNIWRDSHLLRLERTQPRTTRSAKIQPLHVERRP